MALDEERQAHRQRSADAGGGPPPVAPSRTGALGQAAPELLQAQAAAEVVAVAHQPLEDAAVERRQRLAPRLRLVVLGDAVGLVAAPADALRQDALEGGAEAYVLVAAIWPKLFDCRPGLAYVQQCPYPAWSPGYSTDADGNPTEEPYNHDPDNLCVDHGTEHGGALSSIPSQLVVTLDTTDSGPLVRGATGIDGNLPQLGAARPVTACVDFASPEAFAKFRDLLHESTW